MLNIKVKEYLEVLDQKLKTLNCFYHEYKIKEEIGAILVKDKKYVQTKEDLAEEMAFNYRNDLPDKINWDTYYTPIFDLPNNPDEQTFEYWAKRAKETKNPILKSRYADLVVYFNKKTDFELIQIVINSNISICENPMTDSIICLTKMNRALYLAIKTKNTKLINKVKDAILQLVHNTKNAEPDKIFLCYSFKWLLCDFAKKVTLTMAEENELVNKLEEILINVKCDSRFIELAISPLADYYAKKEKEDLLMRVLTVYENSLKSCSKSNEHYQREAYDRIYVKYNKYAGGSFNKAKTASKRMLKEMGQLTSKRRLTNNTEYIEIKQEQIDSNLDSIFGKKRERSIKEIMQDIATWHLSVKKMIKELHAASNVDPLVAEIGMKLISSEGVKTATLPPLAEDDDDGYFKRYALRHTHLDSFFLTFTIDELQKKFNLEDVFKYFKKSEIFKNENIDYLQRAICAYWNKDYLISSHLFIPMIESRIREVVKIRGGLLLKENKLNGYQYSTLGNLLEENQVFEDLCLISGENILFYFKLVLTEKLGMNLRNNFAHGIEKDMFFNKEISARLFHILICISLFSVVNKQTASS